MNSFLHNRQTTRRAGYNYSSPGFYYITICTKNREQRFGHIDNGKMVLNCAGRIAARFIKAVHLHYPKVVTRQFAIMPDHVHAIFEVLRDQDTVGAIHESPLQYPKEEFSHKKMSTLERRQMLIPKIVGWYKMNAAKHINMLENRIGQPVWQRNYHDVIIDSKTANKEIAGYIISNAKRG